MCLLTIAESWLIPKHLGENDKKKVFISLLSQADCS